MDENQTIKQKINKLSENVDSLNAFITSLSRDEINTKADESSLSRKEKNSINNKRQYLKRRHREILKKIELQFNEIKNILKIEKEIELFPDWYKSLDTLWRECFSEYTVHIGEDDYTECDFDPSVAYIPIEDLKSYIKQIRRRIKVNKKIKITNKNPIIDFNKSGAGSVDGESFLLRKNGMKYSMFHTLYNQINIPLLRKDALNLLDKQDSSPDIQAIELSDIVSKLRRATGLTKKHLILNKDITLIGRKKDNS